MAVTNTFLSLYIGFNLLLAKFERRISKSIISLGLYMS